ncbi:neutral ceramidase isoform X2 [Macrosteles quadrilineatus]|uniref:neutral ceramidase isoform X2 n=1 Tax=Macrosteles quadrilineatus TaxID=74068 RepID=UPI0023E1F797|nr:neutral ceramidase isoform X2 [Macrosteles quadrilineatus]
MATPSWLHGLMLMLILSVADSYKFGLGRADVTGPPVEISFMGYGKMGQKGTGIHLRQFSRAFVIEEGGRRLVLASVECGMIGHGLRMEVLQRLGKRYGSLYTEENVMLSGTHTHSAPGGFLMNMLFDLTTLGFVYETFNALASGIVLSIVRAHDNLADGRISVNHGELLEASINRSPTAYQQNPQNERARYTHDVDKTMVQLRFERPNNKVVGAFTWFAVHPTSMNNTNTLVSSDNLGVAALLLEQTVNQGFLPGKGPFVGAFVSSNLGDVSPNLAGPRCIGSGLPCDLHTSSCGEKDECIALGPGRNMMESTRIIGKRLYNKALELLRLGNSGRRYLNRGLRVVHQYNDMSKYSTSYWDPTSSQYIPVNGCPPAMGYSFAAGTTDGPGVFPFSQQIVTPNPLWNSIRNLIYGPSEKQKMCHYPKPIMLTTGEMTFPFEWQPSVVPTQLSVLDNLVLACVPGEFTTMAGRRLRDVLRQSLKLGSNKNVLITGLCNTYADYITTPEEYQIQRYEGASTIFGPHTLPLYLDIYRKLAQAATGETTLARNEPPLDFFNDLISLNTPVLFDNAGWSQNFGQVLQEAPSRVSPGAVVTVKFVGANPRNHLQHEGSYLTVDHLQGSSWNVIATDANWETQFRWTRLSDILGTSQVEVRWAVPRDIPRGIYRIRYSGHFKYLNGKIENFVGTTKNFEVV